MGQPRPVSCRSPVCQNVPVAPTRRRKTSRHRAPGNSSSKRGEFLGISMRFLWEFQWWFLWWFHEAYDVWVISGQTDNFLFGIWAMSATNLDMWGLNQPFHWDILKV
jgi:hypothetical protein